MTAAEKEKAVQKRQRHAQLAAERASQTSEEQKALNEQPVKTLIDL